MTTPCNAAEAAGVAQDIGYPVALKMMSPSLPHKTEAGAVALGLKDAEGLSSAIKAMTATVAAYDRAAVTDRFLIEAMSPKPLAELIVTLRADPQFGPSLVIGSGGVLTELVRDARTVLLPASKDEIERALCSLRVARLLEGYRGSQKADIPRISDALHRFCAAFLEARSQVAEVEINPMFVYPDHIVAVDALIQVPRS